MFASGQTELPLDYENHNDTSFVNLISKLYGMGGFKSRKDFPKQDDVGIVPYGVILSGVSQMRSRRIHTLGN